MTIFLFPGRNSRYPEMIGRIIEAWPVGAEIVSFASRVLDRDLHRQYRSDNQGIFASERDIEVGVFLASHLHLRALEARDVRAEVSAGLGLGEYNHLVHIGALDFDEALKLVDARGAAIGESPRGRMTLVSPVAEHALDPALAEAQRLGVVEPVIYVSPEQQVIAGEVAAVEAAVQALQRRNPAVVGQTMDVDFPAFSSFLAPAGERYREMLRRAKWKLASHLYMPNVLGSPILAYAPEMFVELLSRQMHSPLRWRQTIEYFLSRDPDAVFVEVGPYLTDLDLVPRSWISNPQVKTDAPGDFAVNMVSAAQQLAKLG